jgi:hypothetical protein
MVNIIYADPHGVEWRMASIGSRALKRREAFLSALETSVSVGAAAASCGVSRAGAYRWRERSAQFARQWDDAVAGGADLPEDEARRRALEGTARPVFYKGVQVGDVRHYSDRLLMVLLQARRPQVYRPQPAARPRAVPRAPAKDPYAHIPADLGEQLSQAMARWKPEPPPPTWQPYAAQGSVWADEDDEEGYYDEWTNGPRERTALEEPGPAALRAETSRDAPIPQTTSEYLPHPEKSSSPTLLGAPKGRRGANGVFVTRVPVLFPWTTSASHPPFGHLPRRRGRK